MAVGHNFRRFPFLPKAASIYITRLCRSSSRRGKRGVVSGATRHRKPRSPFSDPDEAGDLIARHGEVSTDALDSSRF